MTPAMPAAGEWRKFDAEDQATWPKTASAYLVFRVLPVKIQVEGVWVQSKTWEKAFWVGKGDGWMGGNGVFMRPIDGVTHYAIVTPPESSAERRQEGRCSR
jgi:hypothetical protein